MVKFLVMKKLALINTYCNNEERLNLLHNNIIKLKKLGIDSLVYSPLPLPKEITKIADFTIISKENPILKWPERAMVGWKLIPPCKDYLIVAVPDYGWASLYQYKKLFEYATTLNYDHFFPMIYDLVLDETITNTLLNPHPKLFFNTDKSKVGIANNFLSLNRENIQKLPSLITKENYLKYCNGSIAEALMLHLCKSIGGEISTHYIKDEISEIHKDQKWNFVPNDFDFELFIDTTKNFKFYFYNLKSPKIELILNINGEDIKLVITPEDYIFNYQKGFSLNTQVKLKYKNQIIDLTYYYSKNLNIEYWIG